MKLKKLTYISFFFIFLLTALSCASDNQAINLDEMADNSTNVGDGGSYSPNTGGSDNVCETDEEGNCIETNDVNTIMVSSKNLDFGLSELTAIECQSIDLPEAVSYEVEIDKDKTSTLDGAYQFTILNASGEYSQERVSGAGTISLCYMRLNTGNHSGQAKVVLTTNASVYAYVISLKGETSESLFNVTSPTEGQIIDEREGQNEGKDDGEGDFLLTVKGSVNLNLKSIFASGDSTPIYINADGVKYKTNFDSNGNFSKQIGVPQVPGVYAITLSMETNKGSTLSKTVNIVVAGSPDLEIELRDTSGNDIDTSVATDVPYLVVGLRVSNLYAAGSNESEMPVTLYDVKFNDEELTSDTDIWYDETWWWCTEDDSGLESKAYEGFDAQQTLCIALDHITELKDGINTISAKAKNALGETSASLTLIIDNDKPIITITKPNQNELYGTNTNKITVSGKIKYFAPISTDLESKIPEAKENDVGSYCQPSSGNDSSCPASSIKMWFNVSTDDANYPIYIYPKYTGSYNNMSESDASSYMENTSGSQGNCYEQEITTEDEEGNEVVSTTTNCDVPEAEFSITLSVPSADTHAHVNLYTNVIQMQAESVKGHRSIEVVTFMLGETSPHVRGVSRSPGQNKINMLTGTLKAGQLGIVNDDCQPGDLDCVVRAPVMLNVSEGILNRDTSEEAKKVIKVVENFMNENVNFADVANGWMYLPKDDNDDIVLEKDYKEQYVAAVNESYEYFEELPMEWRKKFIHQGIHSNAMVTKFWALQRYLQVLGETTNNDCSEEPDLCFFEREGDPETEYNVALDRCGEAITTAFVPLRDLQYLYKAKDPDFDLTQITTKLNEWPTFTDDVNYNDFVSGRWVVNSINLKDNGYVDADVCLMPDDSDYYDLYESQGCETDVSDAKKPAFWGHFVSYNLVEKGLLGQQGIELIKDKLGISYSINDDTIPLIWSIGKLRLKFEDVIQVTKENYGDSWSNIINIFNDKIENYPQSIVSEDKLSNLFDEDKMKLKTIQIEAFGNCKTYYEEELGLKGYFTPFGCDDNPNKNYPFILELNSLQGQTVYSDLTANGQNTSFLGIIWWGVLETFKKMVGCMDEELINPMLSSHHEYPAWVSDASTFSTEFDWEDFTFSANIENSDINVLDGGLTLRLPLSLGVDGVSVFGSFMNQNNSYEEANTKGHLRRRSQNNYLENYPLTSDTPNESAFLGASINLEEIVNAASYLMFKKGPLSLLEILGVDEIEANSNWSVGVDKVVLGRFDICDLAGLIPSELPPSLFFATIQSLFSESSLHLDIILDKDHPMTLSLNPIEGIDNATEVQIGVSNIQIGVKELKTYINDEGETVANVYVNPKDQEEVLRIRLDGVIKARLIYYKDQRQIHVYLPGYEEQNIHASVPSGHGGASYDDVNVVTDVLNGVVKALFDKMGKDISEDIEYDDNGDMSLNPNDANPTLVITLPGSGADIQLTSIEAFELELKVEAAENASCDGDVPYYYGEQKTYSGDFKIAERAPLPDNIKTFNPKILEIDDQDDDEGGDDESFVANKLKLTPFHTKNCESLFPRVTNNDEEESLKEILCEYGIDEIMITPEIIFDNDEGYVHVSADLYFELEEWLKD